MVVTHEIRLWLDQQHINVPVEWLEACIQWLKEENNNQHLPVSQLKAKVYEQWLTTDLQQIGSSCLPSSVLTAQKMLLNGIFPLQVNAFRDISQPAYSQLVKLTKINNENATISAAPEAPVPYWEAKPKRVLMLSLTDGTHCLQGMEYKPISFLSAELPPGTKILVTGPVECRLGILMLTADKIKLLGGDVEHLLQENDQHHILTRALGQDTVEDFDNQQNNRTESQLPQSQDRVSDSPENYETRRMVDSMSSRELYSSRVFTRNEDCQSVQQSSQDFEELDDDDDFLTQLDYEQLDRIEQESNTTQSPDVMMIEDEDEDMLREQLEFQFASEHKEKQKHQSSIEGAQLVSEHDGKFLDTDTEGAPFEYLSHALQNLNPSKKHTLTIKGFITTIISRLECIGDQGWHLSAKINDGSASLEVDLHDKVLYDFIGIKAEEVMLVKNSAQKNHEMKCKIMQAMQQCKQKLQDLNCLMTVEFSPSTPRPCVTKCYPIEKLHIEQLFQRIKKRFAC